MSRNRSRFTDLSLPVDFRYTDMSGSLISSKSGAWTDTMGEFMTDEVTPEYFSKRKRGQFLSVNPLYQSTETFISSATGETMWSVGYNGTFYYKMYFSGHVAASFWSYTMGGDFFPAYTGTYPSWPDKSAIEVEALANARSRGFDMGTFAAEWTKTLDLILNFRKRTLKRAERVQDAVVRKYNRGNRLPLDAGAAFAETWLEARYGHRLLAYDMAAVHKAINRLNSMQAPLTRGYATENSVSYAVPVNHTVPAAYLRSVGPGISTPLHGIATGTFVQEATREVRSGAILSASLQDIISIDPLVTAWEVLPFSFIADWFLNIGDILQAFSPFASEALQGAWVTETETVTNTCICVPGTTGNPTSGWYYLPDNSIPYTLVTQSQTRTRSTASPSTYLAFRMDLNPEKILDLSSIFLSRYAGILKNILKSTRI